ncbi:MAG: hypothetical protein WCB67_03895 [Solirubrobacteraceae bacterium]
MTSKRAPVFYRDLIGLRVIQRDEESVFLAAGDHHHHVVLTAWDGDATTPSALYHFGLAARRDRTRAGRRSTPHCTWTTAAIGGGRRPEQAGLSEP